MTRSVRRCLIAALALGTGLATRPALATSFVMISDQALADQAAVVVDVTVVGAEAAHDYGRIPATDYRVEVERVLKGAVDGGVLVVRVPGGVDSASGLGLRIFGAPRFAAGERALLFLRPAGDGTYRILHLMLGAFHGRRLAGKTVALRDLSEAHEVELPGRDEAGDGDALRDFAAFSDWVEERAEGRSASRGYVLGKAPPANLESASAGYTYLLPDDGAPIRWFGFDSGAEVPWRIHAGGQPGLGEGSTAAAFETALAAWTDDPATNIRYVYAGTTGAGGGLAQSDDVNAVLFDDPYRDDPNEAVEGTFSCGSGGVIAMGGPFFYSRTRTWQGKRYHEAAEGDIVTNDGTECFFSNNPRVAEEVLTHELGHTLGLGHSTNRDAIMYANAHDDGRGARLIGDDLAAVASLYGNGGGGGGGGTGGLAAPRRLVARPASSTEAALTWRDRSVGEEGFAVEVKLRRGAWTQVKAAGPNSSSVVVSGLVPGLTYSFRVRAVAGARASAYSNVAVATMPR
jgi:hypothetical protein